MPSYGRGEFVALRGDARWANRRVEQFLARAEVPSQYFTASKGALPEHELAEFLRLARSSGPGFAAAYDSVAPEDWSGALRLLADAVDTPTVVVIDELPWLVAGAPRIEGALQIALVIIGERVLDAEFPPWTQARDVLLAIGAGETTFTSLTRRTGLAQGSLNRTLTSLSSDLRVVAVRRPLWTSSGLRPAPHRPRSASSDR